MAYIGQSSQDTRKKSFLATASQHLLFLTPFIKAVSCAVVRQAGTLSILMSARGRKLLTCFEPSSGRIHTLPALI